MEGLDSNGINVEARRPVNWSSRPEAADLLRAMKGFNDTTAPYPQNSLIHDLFEENVTRTPEAMVVLCGDQRPTSLASRAYEPPQGDAVFSIQLAVMAAVQYPIIK
jgi:non-ribosomal peptide synthetase component F